MSAFEPTESPPEVWPHRFSVAPMMDYTNVHQRHFQRLLTRKAVLYTEMVTANTSKYDNPRFIASFAVDEPVVLQIGGSDIDHMQDAMKMAVEYGYKEININCGCPSDRVAGSGCFGAKLMLDPQLVVRIVQCMSTVSPTVPITIKCRIGVDSHDSYDELVEFIQVLSTQANVKHFIVHARKAILNMRLTPNENRTIPPLCYDVVYQLVKDFPHLDFSINGGISSYEEARKHFANGIKGVMVGRSAIDDCYYWRHVDSQFYGCEDPGLTRRQILEKYGEYGDAQEKQEGRSVRGELLKPLLNLFRCCKGHKIYRRQLEHHGRIETQFSRALQLAIVGVSDELLDEK